MLSTISWRSLLGDDFIKAAGGGGGKGFRVAEEPDKLQEAFEGAAREGEKFF